MLKQAGVELCQAQAKLGLAKIYQFFHFHLTEKLRSSSIKNGIE